MTTGIRALLAALVGGLLLAGCTSGSGPDRSIGSVPPPLTPSIPGLFRTGVQHCGDPYAVTATTIDATIPLADCPGLVGLRPTPVDSIHVGDEVTIAGLPPRAYLTTMPADLLQAQGTTFVALRQGIAIVTVHGSACLPDSDGNQPDTCTLLKLRIS